MLESINTENILFLDIETVPIARAYEDMDEEYKRLWDKKSSYFRKETEASSDVFYRAGIYAEFGKIVSISVGFIAGSDNGNTLRLKSFYGHDEKHILENFNALLQKNYSADDKYLCAHNGKEFDFPYIARRSLVNQVQIPPVLNTPGKKPWEVKHLDTMELWKFGDYKHYTSLDLLTKIFNISTPKDDISGADVASVYYEENDLSRIVTYCEKDVIATVQLYLKYKLMPVISEENIISVTF